MKLMLLLGVVLALGNIVASVAVLRVSVLSPSQRALQVALIWLVPVIGAVVCAAFASSQAAGSTSSDTSDPLYLSSDGGASGGQDAGFSGCDAGTLAVPGAVTSGDAWQVVQAGSSSRFCLIQLLDR